VKYKAIVYRSYEKEIEFTNADAPEMIDPAGKAEWIARSIDIGEWSLTDVAVDVVPVIEE
jgi:hypothetical protein